MKEKEAVKHCMLFSRDKHLQSTSILNQITLKDEANKSNSKGDIKFISDMIKWRIVIHKTLMNTIPKVFENVKKTEEKTTTAT